MRLRSIRRFAAAAAVTAIGGALAAAPQPVSASSASATGSAGRVAAAVAVRTPVAVGDGGFRSVAVVRGADDAVWATVGGAFFSLGGRTFDDPAVAAAPAPASAPGGTPTPVPSAVPAAAAGSTTVGVIVGVGAETIDFPYRFFYLIKGTDGLLWIRTDTDPAWRLVTGGKAAGHVVVGSGLTAAFQPQSSSTPPRVVFSYLDRNGLVHEGIITIGPDAPFALTLTSDVTGPRGTGAAVNSSGRPLFVGGGYFPGQLGVGTLMQWDGTAAGAATPTRVGLNCGPFRLGTAFGAAGPLTAAFDVAVCRSGVDDSVHFLGRRGAGGLGYGSAQNLGGHIIGSPGIALENTLNVSSVVYVTGTDHRVYSATVTDLGGIFHAGGWTLIGGVALGGVQATSWPMCADACAPTG